MPLLEIAPVDVERPFLLTSSTHEPGVKLGVAMELTCWRLSPHCPFEFEVFFTLIHPALPF